jgi:hypothetical protein
MMVLRSCISVSIVARGLRRKHNQLNGIQQLLAMLKSNPHHRKPTHLLIKKINRLYIPEGICQRR